MHLDRHALFRRHLDCVVRDDRAEQLELLAPDVVYEFPFATDRPRRIEGRDAFRRVMEPLWADARARGVRLALRDLRVIEAADPDVLVGELTFDVALATGARVQLDFVQILRANDGLIRHVREYANPVARRAIEG
jgi:ketosteroid isomerase-like protein